jgi:hypothetical protein
MSTKSIAPHHGHKTCLLRRDNTDDGYRSGVDGDRVGKVGCVVTADAGKKDT